MLWVGVAGGVMVIGLVIAASLGLFAGRRTSSGGAMPPLKSFQFDTVTLDSNERVINRRTLQATSYVEDLGGGVQLEMVEVPAGTFKVGSSQADVEQALAFVPQYNRSAYVEMSKVEMPQHQVTVPKFHIGKFEVTQAQYQAVMRTNPSKTKGDNLPVENVSWDDAVEFCKRLSKKTGREYRLPSEAEWEYACRAGTVTPFSFGETLTPDIVNYDGQDSHAGEAKEPRGGVRLWQLDR